MSLEKPPAGDVVLEAERMYLRRWRVSDAAVQRRLWAERDPRVPAHRRIADDGRPTVEDLEERIRKADPEAPVILFAAVRKDDGEVVGYCGLIANAEPRIEPELAYEFLRAEWGRGLATEAARAVVDWAGSQGHARLWAGVRDWNHASQRVLTKLGFVETSQVDLDPEHGDSHLYVKDL